MASEYFYGVDEQNLKNNKNAEQQNQNSTHNYAQQTQNSAVDANGPSAQNFAQTAPPQYNYGANTQNTQNAQTAQNAQTKPQGSAYADSPPLTPTAQNKKLRLITILGAYLLGLSYIYFYIFTPYEISWKNPILGAVLKFIFVISFFTFGEFLFRNYKRKDKNGAEELLPKASKEANFWLGCGIALSVANVLSTIWYETDASFMQWNNSEGLVLIYGAIALHAVAAYWVLCRAGLLYRNGSSSFFMLDTLNAMVMFPFGRFLALPIFTFKKSAEEHKKAKVVNKINFKNLGVALLAVIVGFIFFSIALNLLTASDENFSNFIDAFELQISFGDLPYYFSEFMLRLVFSLPVSCYLFSLFSGALLSKSKLEKGDDIAKSMEKLRLVPEKMLGFILMLFIALYTLYFAVQGEYFFSAFVGELPTIFTYSEYARQGFFELCQIMALNLVLLAIVAKTSKTSLRESLFLKVTSLVLLVQSLLFAATAFSKLALYIYIYGITDLRLLSSWAVIMLSLAVCLAIINMLNKKDIAKPFILTCAASFTLLCFIAG